MAYANSIHWTANRLQERLVKIARDVETEARDAALCSRVWCELEFAKREWRGMPRLKPIEFERRMKRAGVRLDAPLELPATSTPSDAKDAAPMKRIVKNSPQGNIQRNLLKAKTVPTPPDPTASSAVE
jgi:hypothetical protein